jgi:hypothetical protein
MGRHPVVDPPIVKGRFTPEEDARIVNYVKTHGPQNWVNVLPHRSAKQVRERWMNYLKPDVQNIPWTKEEDLLIFQQFRIMGGKWSAMAKLLPGRSDNAIKNRYNASISKRIRRNASGEEFIRADFSAFTTQKGRKNPKPPRAVPTANVMNTPDEGDLSTLFLSELPSQNDADLFAPLSPLPTSLLDPRGFRDDNGMRFPSPLASPVDVPFMSSFDAFDP